MRMKFKKQILVAFVAGCAAIAANAGGLNSMATEATQILNNAELIVQVKEQIKSNKVQLNQYSTQLSQLYRQYEDARNVGTYISGMGLDGLVKEKIVAAETRAAYEKLFGTVDELSQAWQQRMVEASTTGIPVSKYVVDEGVRIQKGNELAIKRLEQERRIMQTIEQDFALAKNWGDQISHQSGINASIGMLNTQMNRMLQQNARMVQIMAQAQGSDKAREEQLKAEREAQTKTMLDKIQKSNDDARKAMSDAIKAINSGKETTSVFNKL